MLAPSQQECYSFAREQQLLVSRVESARHCIISSHALACSRLLNAVLKSARVVLVEGTIVEVSLSPPGSCGGGLKETIVFLPFVPPAACVVIVTLFMV